MCFYAFYMWCLAIYVFRARLRSIKSGEVSIKYFKAYTGEGPSERTVLIARHYDNQFQVPMLFFIVCTLHIMASTTALSTLILAWLFVASRLCHSWVHLGGNNVQKRVITFAAGWIILILLWIQLMDQALR